MDLRARLERAMRGAIKAELKRFEIGLPFLATVGAASPFVGLFGTVWGIMHSFTSIAQAKDTSLAVVAPGIAEAGAAAAHLGGDPTLFTKYLGELRARLEKSKVNPRSRQSGTVLLRFTIDASGQVLSREVAMSSGSRLLDDAAMAALDRAAPFPSMPQEAGRAPLVVSVPFQFIAR
jgi:TonB family protein